MMVQRIGLAIAICFVAAPIAALSTLNRLQQDKNLQKDESDLTSQNDSIGTKDGDGDDDDEWARTPNNNVDLQQVAAAATAVDDDDEEEETKTYERVVLEGSKIRISCPHILRITLVQQQQQKQQHEAPDTSFASNNNKVQQQELEQGEDNKAGSWRKQFAKHSQQQQQHLQLQLQVKWFRNHVPLMNLNHFQQHASSLFAASRVPSSSTDHNDDEQREASEPESGSGSEFGSRSAFGGSGNQLDSVAASGEGDSMEKELSLSATDQTTELSATVGGSGATLGAERVGRENVNELEAEGGGDRKDAANMLANTDTAEQQLSVSTATAAAVGDDEDGYQWYVNNSGELVINNVSRYFAGKYTCLYDGLQSEVLLDVLVDNSNSDIDEQASDGRQHLATPDRASKIAKETERKLSGRPAKVSGANLGSAQKVIVAAAAAADRSSNQKSDNSLIMDDGHRVAAAAVAEAASSQSRRSAADWIGDGVGNEPIEKGEQDSDGEKKGFESKADSYILSRPSTTSGSSSSSSSSSSSISSVAVVQPFVAVVVNASHISESSDNKESSYLLLDQRARPTSAGPERSDQEEQRSTDGDDTNSRSVDNNPSLEANSIITPMGGDGAGLGLGVELTTTATGNNDRDDELHFSSRSSGTNDGRVHTAKLKSTTTTANKIGASTTRQRLLSSPPASSPPPPATRHPVHVVKSQTIQSADLKLVPGFLYTKQQLHCPVTGRTGLHFSHIYPLLRALCPTVLSPTMRARDGANNELATISCYQLAQRLVYRLISSTNKLQKLSSHTYCTMSAVFDLLWFKDGKQLKFDTNGRSIVTNNSNSAVAGLSTSSLNAKLINFADSFVSDISGGGGDPIASVSDNNDNDNVALPELVRERDSFEPEREDESTSTWRARRRPNQSSISASKWLICPPDGRTLEIDGLSKEATGRYECALKLSIAKFRKIIQQLRQSNEPSKPIKWRNLIRVSHDNDISAQSAPRKSRQQIEMDEQPIRSAPYHEDGHSSSRGRKRALMAQRIARLESILEGRVSSEFALDYIEQSLVRSSTSSSLSRVAAEPIVTVQTFSLLVSERPANACDLWSTIVEAENAYTRRKLADFRRLKRSSTFAANNHHGNNKLEITSSAATSESSATEQTVAADNENQQNDFAGSLESQSVDFEEGKKEAINSMLNLSPHKSDSIYLIAADQSKSPNDNDSATLNRMHLMMPDDVLTAGSGSKQRGRNLLMNNAEYEIPSGGASVDWRSQKRAKRRQIGNHQQTKNRRSESQLFDYANERNLEQLYGPSASASASAYAVDVDVDKATRAVAVMTSGRRKRSSSLNLDAEGLADGEYMNEEQIVTSDSITQKGYRGSNIQSSATALTNFQGANRGVQNSLPLQLAEYPSRPNGRGNSPVAEPIIDDNSRGSEGENEGGTVQISAVRDSIGSRQNSKSSLNIANMAAAVAPTTTPYRTSATKKVLAPGYKLQQQQQLGRSYSGRDTNSQLDSQLISSANRSNGLAQPPAIGGDAADYDATNQQRSTGNVVEQAELTDTADVSLSESPDRWRTTETPREPLSLIDELLVYDDRFDESLMWKASQYLYMHMRAVAASSMFGVELSVEWSNERVNGSSSSIESATGQRLVVDEAKGELQADRSASRSYQKEIRDSVPFATINVIPGQNLQLQCTAQALGRLPEVKWYKRIATLPFGLNGVAEKMVRRIGRDLYWPLTELDLLNDHEAKLHSRSFVCSQTTAVFDNLANQTFTIVNNLQLGQYNDRARAETVQTNSLDSDDYNLYACIVDADIRHNYATLGVHFRDAPNQMPFKIRKRLEARTASAKSEPIERKNAQLKRIGTKMLNKYPEFDLYRESLLQFPLQSYWIPIKNKSSREDSSEDSFVSSLSLTPTLLGALITIALGSLLALVYLTLRTYRALMQSHLDEEPCDDILHQSSIDRISSPMVRNQSMKSDFSGCFCQYANSQTATLEDQQHTLARQFDSGCGDKLSTGIVTEKVLYEAHSHIDHYDCLNDPLAELPSGDKTNYLIGHYHDQLEGVCCNSNLHTRSIHKPQPTNNFAVNMVENPLHFNLNDF